MMHPTGKKYDEIHIGDKASFEKTIREEDVIRFADVTGDHNPVHVDEDFARQSLFGERVAHGFLTGSLISTVLGTRLPGPGTVFLRQEMNFVKPVKLGDTLTAVCEVVEKRDDKKILTLKTVVSNQHGEVVLEGLAVVVKHEK